MERLGILISKLQEQFNQRVPLQQMMVTIQMIQQEVASQQVSQPGNHSKVAVVLPRGISHNSPPATDNAPVPTDNPPVSADPLALSEQSPFNPVTEVPTLAHQKEIIELNDKMASRTESLNDKLRQERLELGSMLKEGGVKDLKKAIGINDRFLFINDLFRGDETMYERSIKTINNFHILPEAEYWMERELKIKLGWNDHTPLVRHFYQQVKRRFS